MELNLDNLFAKTNQPFSGVRFHHVRNVSEQGIILGKGGITVAYMMDQPGTVVYAVARCHPRDNYNKRQGRAKASGRLMSQRYVNVYVK